MMEKRISCCGFSKPFCVNLALLQLNLDIKELNVLSTKITSELHINIVTINVTQEFHKLIL